ncbi:MAG: hypothetical protein RLZZ546_1127 [Bacteroidota bacterium]|jgi:type VI secretion system secreted protein VgrG
MGGKFVVRAGQHIFESGEKIVSELPFLPTPSDGKYILEFDVRHKMDNKLLKEPTAFSLIDSKGNVRTGIVPKDGIVRITSNDKEEKYTIMVHKVDAESTEESK